jgi:hypothetical protein
MALKLAPTAPQSEPAVLVTDLDKIVTKTAAFPLHGVMRFIAPLPAVKFFEYAEASASLANLKKDNLADQRKFALALYDVARAVMEPITFADIEKCTIAQQAALYVTILDCVTGKALVGPDYQKKKTRAGRILQTLADWFG